VGGVKKKKKKRKKKKRREIFKDSSSHSLSGSNWDPTSQRGQVDLARSVDDLPTTDTQRDPELYRRPGKES
jgi:hypothetical protein